MSKYLIYLANMCLSLSHFFTYVLIGYFPSKEVLLLAFFFFFVFLGLHEWHMEVPRLGVKRELQLPAYTTATATQDPSLISNLDHSSRQQQILNPLSEARDGTRVLVNTSQIHFYWATMGTPCYCFLCVDLEFSHLTNIISSATFLVSWFSGIYCVTRTTSTVLYTSNKHKRACYVPDFSGTASKV